MSERRKEFRKNARALFFTGLAVAFVGAASYHTADSEPVNRTDNDPNTIQQRNAGKALGAVGGAVMLFSAAAGAMGLMKIKEEEATLSNAQKMKA